MICQASEKNPSEYSEGFNLPMKFKIGFEFQEISGLCSWALNDNNYQKKQFFKIMDKRDNSYPWSVVIDTNDIEFVTRPFSCAELIPLQECMTSLVAAIDILFKLLTDVEEITFDEWAAKLILFNQEPSFRLELTEHYKLISKKSIRRPQQKWKPDFTPQVTIQHPLNFTIPLYFSLFGFDSQDMMPFAASLPFREDFSAAIHNADEDSSLGYIKAYHQKMNGLVFLHALTLIYMTPIDANDSDTEFLKETHENYRLYNQIDPKIKFNLMSRRPFSRMLNDINSKGNYAAYFQKVMSKEFIKFYEVPPFLQKTNYAEQFFDSQTGQIKSLEGFLPLFKKEFLDNCDPKSQKSNKEIVTSLLKEGIISTAMIRNIQENITVDDKPVAELFNNVFELSLEIIAIPLKRYIINSDTCSIESNYHNHDVLSPPWILHRDNSMGRFHEDLEGSDKLFGEAIVEIRGISRIQQWFLKRAGLNENLSGEFLREPSTMVEQTVALFSFLTSFGSNKDYREIFFLGIPSALRKY